MNERRIESQGERMSTGGKGGREENNERMNETACERENGRGREKKEKEKKENEGERDGKNG